MTDWMVVAGFQHALTVLSQLATKLNPSLVSTIYVELGTCSLISKLCDHPLNFFFTKLANSANFLGWFYDKDVFTPL